MIQEIEITNYRSILHSKLSLLPFTVIVGANATGKSNIVKAIEFLSDLAYIGLIESVNKRGGMSEILPKQIKRNYGVDVFFKIKMLLLPPKNWSDYDLPRLEVCYQIKIAQEKNKGLTIKSEKLEFKHALLLSYFLVNKGELPKEKRTIDKSILEQLFDNNIVFEREGNEIKVKNNFKENAQNNKLYVKWLGLENLVKKQKEDFSLSKDEIDKAAYALLNTLRPGVEKENQLILSRERSIDGFSTHYRKVMRDFMQFGKYDLLINELRQEQKVARSNKVNPSGDNIPSVAKNLIKSDKEAWNRILGTMSNISPYFNSVGNKTLRAGKEYIYFSEIYGGRAVESWESSDGTLRAFAILLALESHPMGATVMIEEPEHGLHPWAIRDLMSHIRNVIEERNLQVIITTHSQQVLQSVYPSELLISERDKKGTKYKRINEILENPDISVGEIGDLWVRGLLKGVPS